MRELKFRVWDAGLEKFLYWDGHYFEYVAEPWGHMTWEKAWRTGRIEQFTGLHDKNGREIWEGDIVCGPFGYRVLVAFGWTKDPIDDHCVLGWNVWGDDKILGNRHENPELQPWQTEITWSDKEEA